MTDVRRARRVVVVSFLGWALDAFDFFIMIFVFSDVAKEFGVSITSVTVAVTLTLVMRPVGALVFGRFADGYGRRPALMVCILSYSMLELASGFAPTLATFLILRAAFGIAMGGAWGIGSSLAMETVPAHWRGWVSGLLQSGYPSGYFLAALVYYAFLPTVGWRGLFMIGAIPALLVIFIYRNVPESPDWQRQDELSRPPIVSVLREHAGLAIYAVILMTAMNFLSHGTQDIYPNIFLGKQHGFNRETITAVTLFYNLGAIFGGVIFGAWSQRIGRRLTTILAATLLLPIVPFWAFASSPFVLAGAAFLLQICVQGAWSVIPAHLNELSPRSTRATFPGFVYQLGNLLASYNATLQSSIGDHMGGNYSWALASVASTVAVVIIILMLIGREGRHIRMGVPPPSIP